MAPRRSLRLQERETTLHRAWGLLRLDACAGLLAGATVLLLCDVLALLHRWDRRALFWMGAANLLYGSYSAWLVVHTFRHGAPPRRGVEILVAANLTWSVVCALLLIRLGATVSASAWAHLLFEGLFVAGLAIAEWRWVRPVSR